MILISVELKKKPVDVISLELANKTVNIENWFYLVDNFLDVNGNANDAKRWIT